MGDWIRHAIWWQVYPLGFVGAFPSAQPPGPRAAPAAPADRLARSRHRPRRLGDRARPGLRLPHPWLRHHRPLPHRPQTGDDGDFDRRWSTRPTGAGFGCCSTGCSTTSAPTSPHRDAVDRRDPEAASWFRGRPGASTPSRATAISSRSTTRNPAVVDYTVGVMSHWLKRAPTAGASTPPTRCPNRSGPRRFRGFAPTTPKRGSSPRSSTATTALFVDASGVDSVTQYELWKAVWSSLNDGNFHELDWASSGTTPFRTPSPPDLRRQPRRHPHRQQAGTF